MPKCVRQEKNMAIDFSKVRKWQVQFAVHRAFESLPVPEVVVEEIQRSPAYRMDGRLRADSGGQLVITIGGRGRLRVDGVDYDLVPGRAFLHNHSDPRVCYYYPADGTAPWNFLWLSFWGEPIEALIRETNRKYGYLFDLQSDGILIEKLMSYKSFKNEILVLTPLEGARLVYDAIGMLCDSTERDLRSSSRSSMVGEVQRLITTNPAAELKVETMAREFRISREHLSRTFREQTGMTLHDYITKVRLRLAVDLLLQTRLTVKEIADRCGWSEYTIFYRTFKRRFGVTPNELRDTGFRPQI